MSTPKKKQQTTDTITAALDAIAEGLASDIIGAVAAKRVLDNAAAATVGSFLLAYRQDRDEREAKRANVRGAGVGE